MSGALIVRDEGDRLVLGRKGGAAVFWITKGELQRLWQEHRPPVYLPATIEEALADVQAAFAEPDATGHP